MTMKAEELQRLFENTRSSNIFTRFVVWCVLAYHFTIAFICHPIKFTKVYVRELSK